MNETDSKRKEHAEALVRLSRSNDGQAFIKALEDDFDKSMRALLAATSEEIMSAQGHARALRDVLKKFHDAETQLNRQR